MTATEMVDLIYSQRTWQEEENFEGKLNAIISDLTRLLGIDIQIQGKSELEQAQSLVDNLKWKGIVI